MFYHNWKELIKTDFTFDNLLREIVAHEEVSKLYISEKLQLSAKFELIRMESFGLLEFIEDKVVLGNDSESLVESYQKLTLQSAV